MHFAFVCIVGCFFVIDFNCYLLWYVGRIIYVLFMFAFEFVLFVVVIIVVGGLLLCIFILI